MDHPAESTVRIRYSKQRSRRPSEPAPANSHGFLLPADPSENFLTGEEWGTLTSKLRLTGREVVVASLLLQGQTRKGIAKRLKLSPETVRVYIDRLFEKFNVQDRLALGLRLARIREMMRHEIEPVLT